MFKITDYNYLSNSCIVNEASRYVNHVLLGTIKLFYCAFSIQIVLKSSKNWRMMIIVNYFPILLAIKFNNI